MCMTTKAKVIQISGKKAVVEINKITKEVNIELIDGLCVNEFVFISGGVAVEKAD